MKFHSVWSLTINSLSAVLFIFLVSLYIPSLSAQTSIVKENISCKVLGSAFSVSHNIQVQCGKHKSTRGFVDPNTRLTKFSVLVKDKKTGRERRIFHDVNNRRDGGFEEDTGYNFTGSPGDSFTFLFYRSHLNGKRM